MAAFSGPGPDYLDSDVHLVHNDHHAAADWTTKIPSRNQSAPVDGELVNIAVEDVLGTLSVHDLAIVTFSSTRNSGNQDRGSLFDPGSVQDDASR